MISSRHIAKRSYCIIRTRKIPERIIFSSAFKKAYDILSDPVKRKQFDSVDPTVIDTVPSCKSVSMFDEFKEIFDPIFESQKRFSKKEPVPSIGEADSSREDVDNFYRFWSNFESWRSFEWNDEDQPSSADNREDKRWFDKKNKAARLKHKNEDNARIIKLVELVMKLDPRIKQFKEQDKLQKEAKKQTLKGSRCPVPDARNKLADEKKQRETAIMAARQRMLDEKLQKDKTKASINELKKEIENIMSEKNYFLPPCCDSVLIENQLVKLNAKFSTLSLEQLQQFKQDLLTNGAKALEESPKSAPEQSSVPSSVSSEWSSIEMQFLIEAVKQFPGGIANRWEKITSFIANKSKLPERPLDEVIQRADALKQAPKAVGSIDALLHETQVHKPKSVDSRIHQNAPTEAMNVVSFAIGEDTQSTQWSVAEFGLLENGLALYPSSDPERWDKIAAMVKTRSKKECKKKFIEIAEKLKIAKDK